MKNYLSFGGGVNSVALYLLLMEQGLEPGNAETGFEAVYVWMPDWPETHEYLMMMEYKGYPITTIFPNVYRKNLGKSFYNLYDFCIERRILPLRYQRWCTGDFKVKALNKYFKKPCFVNIGIDYGEIHRAKISSNNGMEYRHKLIEYEMDRNDCIKLIKQHNLPEPIKSGCYICPFQQPKHIRHLRRKHPDLFCKAVSMENEATLNAIDKGYDIENAILIKPRRLLEWVEEKDSFLFDDMAYPPCECGL
jgi:hypothetical protein